MNIGNEQQNKIKLGLKVASLLAFFAGLALALLTLASAAGIWLGMWDFRQGFTLLGAANQYAGVIAYTCSGLTLGILAGSLIIKSSNTTKVVSIAAIGSLIASLAYYIPESFRQPEGVNYPPIHDISTDTESPPEFVAVLPLRIDAANTVVYGGSNNMTPERLSQLTAEAYPDLVSQYYAASVDEVFDRTLAAVDRLGWELVSATRSAGRIEATDTTLWVRFKDDIVIIIEAQGNQTLVNARSVSRVGTGDVGANAIRLRAFFALL